MCNLPWQVTPTQRPLARQTRPYGGWIFVPRGGIIFVGVGLVSLGSQTGQSVLSHGDEVWGAPRPTRWREPNGRVLGR